jgi:sarcosine oxidase subunit alpha
MPESIEVTINGKRLAVPKGVTVAAALLVSGNAAMRRSVTRELRGPVCGMGVCFECRVTVNGWAHVRSCQTICESGMEIRTDE